MLGGVLWWNAAKEILLSIPQPEATDEEVPFGRGVQDHTLSSQEGTAGRKTLQEETFDQGVAKLTTDRASSRRPR
eukprot:3896164-Prorocentrum_lima.AAC.1